MSILTPCPSRQNFFYKNHEKVQRESAGDPVTLPDGRVVRFEIATSEDVDLVSEQMLYGFVNQIGMYRAIGSTEDDMRALFREMTVDSLSHDGTIMGFIDDDLVTLWVTKYFTKEDIVKNFGRRAEAGEKPVFEIPEDYGTIFDSMPWPNFNAKLIMTILTAVDEQWGKFMPDDLEKLSIDEGIFVHDSLRGTKIGNQVLLRSQQLARNKGCNYTGMVAVAVASQKLAKKNGYELSFSLPFDKICVHGEYPIKDTWDGTTQIEAVLKKL
uniref:N-acetyltransferase domain-containing protein n=1 Tax=Panagrellus redivivus TaxID=6233 RepID=A0A7E4UVZ7_PANRE